MRLEDPSERNGGFTLYMLGNCQRDLGQDMIKTDKNKLIKTFEKSLQF